MKSLLNQKCIILFATFLFCFSFLNFKCTDIAKPPITQPETQDQKGMVVYMEVLNYWAAQFAYNSCVKSKQNCSLEKDNMVAMEKLARIIVIPPLPKPPKPCTPIGNCDNLVFLDYMVHRATDKYLVSVFDKKSNKLLARNNPNKIIKSKLVKGYVNTANDKFVNQYSGMAVVEIKNLKTNDVGRFEMKMQ